VELGLLGGGAFLAAFYLCARITHLLGRGVDAPRWAVESRHFVFAVIIGYGMGCASLSRNFVVPTFLALGLASVLLDQAAWQLPAKFQVSRRWFVWLAVFSVCGLVLMKFMTQGLGTAGF
jgi:hypothetical protein